MGPAGLKGAQEFEGMTILNDQQVMYEKWSDEEFIIYVPFFDIYILNGKVLDHDEEDFERDAVFEFEQKVKRFLKKEEEWI